MVQDMLGKEFFSDVYQVTAEGGDGGGSTKLLPGRYKDVVQCGVSVCVCVMVNFFLFFI
ncbi:hypothetical protein E2C01_097673 [Portunus trituberculatus]|uniref:Uncharacterized protein n=1 Tax=Portunus trituberculatus TaxID=210409 RepID=A0A5B7K6C6_PORTR|nr:hypothetical protein [Portunus trituberculatus]